MNRFEHQMPTGYEETLSSPNWGGCKSIHTIFLQTIFCSQEREGLEVATEKPRLKLRLRRRLRTHTPRKPPSQEARFS